MQLRIVILEGLTTPPFFQRSSCTAKLLISTRNWSRYVIFSSFGSSYPKCRCILHCPAHVPNLPSAEVNFSSFVIAAARNPMTSSFLASCKSQVVIDHTPLEVRILETEDPFKFVQFFLCCVVWLLTLLQNSCQISRKLREHSSFAS